MTHVRRDELVDYVTWEEDLRPAQRPDILAAKELRRVVIGPLTFLFENPDTIRALEGPLRDVVVEAYRAAFSETYAVMIGVMLIAICVTRLMRDPAVPASN